MILLGFAFIVVAMTGAFAGLHRFLNGRTRRAAAAAELLQGESVKVPKSEDENKS